MKALKIGGIVLLVLLGIVLILSAIAPKEVVVERSVVIAAPREAIFPHIVLFEKRNAWSPWAKMDPNMKLERIGQDGTVGAISKWEGNENVGKGQEEIKLVTPNERVETALTFIEPWESKSDAWIQLEDANGGTKVSWGIKSPMPMPMNIMGLFMNMDAMIGKDFENGLNDLKTIAEKEKASMPATANYEIKKIDMPERWYIALREVTTMDGLGKRFEEQMPKVYEAVTKKGIAVAGQPCGLYYQWDESSKKVDLAYAIPVKSKVEVPGYSTIELPASAALLIDYYGPYEESGAAHMAMDAHLKANNLKAATPVVEEYVTDPGKEPDPKKWLTKIIYSIQ